MTKKKYQDAQVLKNHLLQLKEQKFKLDCGHKVTIGGPIMTIIFTVDGKVICHDCGY